MDDTISRQAAIDALMAWEEDSVWDDECLKHRGEPYWVAPSDVIERLPSAQQTLYGYRIEHLALIARVMQKENVSPEKAIKCFDDIGKIVQMIMDEQKEIIKKAVEEYEG